MNISYEGKVIIITGGSRGIGRGLVKAFSSLGGKVYFTYLSNDESAAKVVEECKENVKAFKVDGRNKDEVKQFINRVISEESKVDVLINNAGYIPRGLFLSTNQKVWRNTMESNVDAVYSYCSEVLRYMILNKSGVILNITTVSANQPGKGQAAYGASKAAIESLSKVLALENGRYNIRVNTIAPGLVETEVVKTITPKVKERILSMTPLKRFGEVDDISNAAVFLASEYASYITGVQLLVTGGRHLE